MTPFWDTFEEMDRRPPAKRSKTDETKIAWLATQVAPTLHTLQERGKLYAAIRALFGQELSESAITSFIQEIEKSRGNYADSQ